MISDFIQWPELYYGKSSYWIINKKLLYEKNIRR